MPYQTVYEIRFTPAQTSDLVIIRIYKKSSFNPNPLTEENIIPLNDDHDRVPVGNLQLRTTDNDEDKFSPIKATQAEFSFFSTPSLNLNTFITDDGEEYPVKIFINSALPANLYFQGFLVVSGMTELLQPHPQVVTLTATDNIGLLRDIPLTDFDGLNPKGKYKVIEFIAMAMSKTGIELPFAVINNIMEENSPGIPFYESCYLDAKTFEEEIGTCISCYEVLERILAEDAFIFQWKAKYYIVRVDELDWSLIYTHNFDFDGSNHAISPTTDYTQTINSYQAPGVPIPYFMNENALVGAELMYKEISETFNLELPKEIPDNSDFSRGTSWISPIVVDTGLYFKVYPSLSDFPATGEADRTYKATNTGFFYKWRVGTYVQIFGAEVPEAKAYVNEDWAIFKDADNPIGVGATTFIVKIFELGYEASRYAVIKRTTTAFQYIRSNRIPVGFNDKFNFSVSTRFNDDINSGFARHGMAQIKLYGDDGSHWYLHGGTSVEPAPKWYPTDPTFQTDRKFIVTEQDSDNVDLRDWRTTIGGQAPPIPVSGELEILLNYSNNIGNEVHFSDLKFEYIPFVNGSYQRYSATKNIVSNSSTVKAKREKQVYISNSPKKLYKGALHILQSGKYLLAGRFYAGNAFPGGLPSFEYLHPFGFIQAYAVWNQYNRVMRIIDAEIFGLKTDDIETMPDLLHKYTLVDPTPHGNNKMFMLLHKEQDFDNNLLRGRLIEVFDTVRHKVYDDQFQFKYITE